MALLPRVEAHRLTPNDVSQRLKVRVETVRNWINTGALPAVNVGGSKRPAWRISESALGNFVERRYDFSEYRGTSSFSTHGAERT